jgi:hypothetical protein
VEHERAERETRGTTLVNGLQPHRRALAQCARTLGCPAGQREAWSVDGSPDSCTSQPLDNLTIIRQ